MLLLYGFDAVARAITSGIQLNSDALTLKTAITFVLISKKSSF